MASKILIKRSTTSGSVPTTSDLDTGELGLNTADKRVYTNNAGTIVELGTYPSSLNVTGNTDLDGTLNVDGASTLASGTVSGNWTVTGTLTVSTPTNSTDAASKGYVDTAVANVIDSAPGALDTLNELAAAINDDANFATTITNSIATKLALAGGTMTGDIVLGSNKITTTADPATDNSLTRKSYVDGILGSATAAATSAAAAATSATNAANSATSASGSATTATTQAAAAASSASAASTSETNAASSATSAANSATAAATSATNAATSESNASDSESAAATSETNAATSASSASTSATSASNSATSAASSATTATTKASEASTSASNASTSETNAAASASAAATSETNAASSASAASSDAASVASLYDQFDDRYLGSKASAPSVDNDGNALLTGALYWDTTAGGLYVYNGSSWEIAGDRDELLQTISASISDTAVDVFVYDTRKDSDGGAWRKRTQHTSWYNETLNTSTRGSRKEFPAVAVIVAESGQVTIYDGDDPSLPMWMVFEIYSSYAMHSGSSNSIAMLNGILARGSEYGFTYLNFITEFSYRLTQTVGGWNEHTQIVQRNQAKSENFNISLSLVNQNVNDVAMTVLPNAPIDSATGLPVPTIAVATDGGVSVIKDDGTVVDITSTGPDGSPSLVTDINFTNNNEIIFSHDSNWEARYGFSMIYEIPSTDISGNAFGTTNRVKGFYQRRITDSAPSDATNYLPRVAYNYGMPNEVTKTTENQVAIVTHAQGIVNATVQGDLINYIESDYNTGWMNGDIKLATLSDTDDTDVTGTELVTNGTFDSDLSGWSINTDSNGTIVQSSGAAVITSNGGSGYPLIYQGISTVVGKKYTWSVDWSNNTTGLWVRKSDTPNTVSGTNQVSMRQNSTISSGTDSITFTATATTSYLAIFAEQANSGSVTVDNVSVRLAEEDRSVNNNGLQVFGTVTKNPVATGADLVAYSGFSSSNYLQQPYNSDLDFGTGDFCVMGWFKAGSITSNQTLLSKHDNISGTLFQLNIFSGVLNFYSSGWKSSGYSPSVGIWEYLTVIRESGTLYIYANGALKYSVASTDNYTLSGSTLRLGINHLATWPLLSGGSLALWRISATAPSAEQIKTIYESEKHLFTENAKCTLTGTSDAVTALAYDSDENLLHVGTSAGRSVFSGLRRVDETATGVTSAISASNGMVVEQ
jgi:hypothetical protein